MSESKQTRNLPPRHSGYRAVASTSKGSIDLKPAKSLVPPKAPTGAAGGSK